MEISDKCAMKGTPDEKPDFSTLLSYGNESVMLEKLITETEKEMQAVKDAEQKERPSEAGCFYTPSAKFMGDTPF